jgi:nicotinamide phosphoribosyltransferase
MTSNNENYLEKYQKYKTKYLKLVKQTGGVDLFDAAMFAKFNLRSDLDLLRDVILQTDSYKLTHWRMYQQIKTTHIYSYLEARRGAMFDKTVWFGLHYLIKQLEDLQKYTSVQWDDFIAQGEVFTNAHIGPGYFNKAMWTFIKEQNGKLPIKIRSVREGSIIPVDNVLLTIENTDQDGICAPLVNHLETFLLHVWYSSTVATLSRCVRDIIFKYIKLSESDAEAEGAKAFPLPYMLHDFGFRGVSSTESAAIGTLGHLLNFKGTDTIAGILLGMKYYNINEMLGVSVPATEHSIMTSFGKNTDAQKQYTYAQKQANGSFQDKTITLASDDAIGEFNLVKTLVAENPHGILSMVLDSYNIFTTTTYLCTGLLAAIKARFTGLPGNLFPPHIPHKVVIRPDSGEPSDVVPKLLAIIEQYTGEVTRNSKGFKLLPAYFGILWGDGMEPATIISFLKGATSGWGNPDNRWAARNFIFGMGGGLLQKVNRDTQRYAFKCSARKTSDEAQIAIARTNNIFDPTTGWIDIQKDPVTTSGEETKKSKAGRLQLINNPTVEGGYSTVKYSPANEARDLLMTVYENGVLYPGATPVQKESYTKFDQIQAFADAQVERYNIDINRPATIIKLK